MTCYFDSSFLLSALLEQRPAAEHSVWDRATRRLSSDLLRFECHVSIRRVAALQPQSAADSWLDERTAILEQAFQQTTFKSIDEAIEAVVRGERRLADCRTLDAIHMATALYFSPHLDEPLVVCTFDRRLRRVATALGFAVSPERLDN